jgi:hypothetical protein
LGNSAAGRIRATEKSNDFIGNRTCGLPACSTVSTKYVIACPGDLGVDGKTIIRCIINEQGVKYVYWINLARNRNQYGTLTKTAINLRFY